jgi:hypothetical protein
MMYGHPFDSYNVPNGNKIVVVEVQDGKNKHVSNTFLSFQACRVKRRVAVE